jgi:hypothetical protein
MKSMLQRHTITFIVRVWAEYLEQTPPSWRGEVERLDSGEQIHFRQLSQVLNFIQFSAAKQKTDQNEKEKEQ